MLELIVLGQVPGTGIVITLPWILGAATIFVGSSLLYVVRKKRFNTQLSQPEQLTV